MRTGLLYLEQCSQRWLCAFWLPVVEGWGGGGGGHVEMSHLGAALSCSDWKTARCALLAPASTPCTPCILSLTRSSNPNWLTTVYYLHNHNLTPCRCTGTLRTSVFWGKIVGVPTYLIRPADWNACNIFRGGRIYGGSYDEKEAYLYLCRYGAVRTAQSSTGRAPSGKLCTNAVVP